MVLVLFDALSKELELEREGEIKKIWKLKISF